MDKEIIEIFRIGKKFEDSSKPRPLLKFENLMTENFILDNSNKLRESEQFMEVIESRSFQGRQCRIQKAVYR